MKKIYLMLAAFTAVAALNAQTFTNSNNLLDDDYNSGGCLGVSDMDNDGFDDIILLDNSTDLKIIYQTVDGMSEVSYGTVSGANQWGMAVGDVDNDGHSDVFSGGNFDGTHLVKIANVGVSEQQELNNGQLFMQGCNLADIDNDGMLDAFGCHDVGLSKIWMNNGTTLVYDGEVIDLESYDFSFYPDTDHSGNYGSTWTDFDDDGDIDLFIAKCRQGVGDATDPRRINQLWVNDGNNNYTEQAVERGLVPYEQSWTSDFADIDNDGDFDCLLTNHSNTMLILENNAGYFTDITEGSGLAIAEFFLQAKMADFDNDGFVDLIYSGGGHKYMRNNGDNTFTEVPNMFPNGDTMHSLAVGDLNRDGWLDVYASYGDTYVNPDYNNEDILWMNNGGVNNYIVFDLEGIESNMNAVGAKVKITGAWGTQVREVRAGESYGINNTFHCHFGIGENTEVDEVVITWPSGTTTVLEDPEINTFHEVLEAPCQIASVEIVASGELVLCPGESVMLTAPNGYTYDWSNGTDVESITVTESGNYSVVVYDENGCAGVSNQMTVQVSQSVDPTVLVQGETEFCEGGTVDLISSSAASYDWGNGLETQSISVTESGEYQVTIVDACDNMLSSETVTVTVLAIPSTPVVDDQVTGMGSVTLDGGSATLLWYENEDDTSPVYEGASFDTPIITESTTYYVEDVNVFGGEEAMGGRFDNTGAGQYHDNSTRWQLFDAYEPFTLVSVEVFANGTADRTIELIDNLGNSVQSETVNIEDGQQTVMLNWEIEPGTDYGLRCTNNNPQLWRNGLGAMMDYPYMLGDLGAITRSTATGDNSLAYYYFFYNWTVATPTTACYSDRVPVTITFVGVEEIEGLTSLTAYPNPVQGLLNVKMEMTQNAQIGIEVIDMTGRVVESISSTVNTGKNTFQIDLTDVAAGMYQLRATINGNATAQPLIVK